MAFIPGIAAGACALGQPLATGRLIDAVTANDSLTMPIVLLTSLFLAEAGLSAVHGFLLARIGEGLVLRLRLNLIGTILRLADPSTTGAGEVTCWRASAPTRRSCVLW